VIVLDTNVISELMRPQPAPAPLAWVDAQPADALAITAITAAELLYGVARLPSGARKRALSDAVTALVREEFAGRVLPFDVGAAEHYADIVVECERRGRPISAMDAQIAAVCRSCDAALATRNVTDFEEAGIGLVDPWTSD
jgi:predicted nucleic acid-binding protein